MIDFQIYNILRLRMEEKLENTNSIVSKSYTDPVTGKFAPGNPGGGRPVGSKNFTTKVREALEKVALDKDGKETGKTKEQLLIESILRKAISGDTYAMKLLWNYFDGMPQQKVDHTTGGEKLFRIFDIEK